MSSPKLNDMEENKNNLSQKEIYSYFDRDSDLRVLFIFNEPFLKDELNDATWEDGYRYVVFKGDWFTCKYLLDTEWENDKVIMYFDQGSPLSDRKSKENFPLMDVLTANAIYHHQDYSAFMQQHNIPPTMAAFVEQNITILQSTKMLNILAPSYKDGSINISIATRAIISMFLGQQRVLEWDDILIRILLQGRKSEKTKQTEFFRKFKNSPSILTALDNHFKDIFGVGIEVNSEAKVGKIIPVLKYNAIVQDLAPVDNDNYKSHRICDSIALQQMNRILEIAQSKHADSFKEVMKELGATIRCEEIVKWYGTAANYNYIPDDLCVLILHSLLGSDIENESEIVIDRVEYLLSVYNEESSLGLIMDYIVCVARYYETTSNIVSITLKDPEEYIKFYEDKFYVVDQLYRNSLELFYKIDATSTLFTEVQHVKITMDLHYAKIANRINLEWSKCLQEGDGLKSLTRPKQWEFYNTFVKPLQKKVAVIVCDALRYEMAKQVVEEIARINNRHIAEIFTGIATIPSETKFCKPSLLPHKDLKLVINDAESNMSVDDKVLKDTDSRSSHLQTYKEGAICVSFETIAEYNNEKNREIFKHPLVYIFHNSIDEVGHSNNARQIVNGCTQAIKDIAMMVPKILSSYNVTEVIVTSDHGFLFNDIAFEEKDKLSVKEDSLEQKSRYYLTASDDKAEGIIKLRLSDVSGMTNREDVIVAAPLGTNRLAAPAGGYMFAHGGATLEEVIIPIIICDQKRDEVKKPVGVMVLDQKLSVQSSRIRFKLLQTESVNMERCGRTITVALYLNDVPVTQVVQFVLDKTDALLDNRKILVDLTLNKNVSASLLQLKVYDTEDSDNPLVKVDVTNNTLIDNDFDF